MQARIPALAAILCGGVLLAAVPASGGGDPAQGKVLARQCVTCHGIQGIAKIPIAPHIGGESVPYITHQLEAFRDGRRVHEMMSVVAKGLTDEAIAHLAAWYTARTLAVTPPAGRDPAAAPELCVACHGADGLAVNPDAPNLAGESTIYIETQIKAFRTGKRSHEVMTGIAQAMTDDELRAAAEWYSAIRVAPAGG